LFAMITAALQVGTVKQEGRFYLTQMATATTGCLVLRVGWKPQQELRFTRTDWLSAMVAGVSAKLSLHCRGCVPVAHASVPLIGMVMAISTSLLEEGWCLRPGPMLPKVICCGMTEESSWWLQNRFARV